MLTHRRQLVQAAGINAGKGPRWLCRGSSHPGDGRQPGVDAVSWPSDVDVNDATFMGWQIESAGRVDGDAEPGRFDGVHPPPVAEAGADLVLGDPARAPVAWLEITEAAGLEVTLDASGTPRRLGAAADQAAYRILQEALTNAARHGGGSARIELAFGDSAVELTVTNLVRQDRSPRPGGGHGLIGMRERATILGGTLDAERANGAFRVSARIPYGGHPA